MTRVLLIDDDVELTAMLQEYLQQEGFETAAVHDGEAGVAEALSGRHAIVVLDVMLPRLNGVEALRRIRTRSRVPVLMLTARGDDVDRIVGLELGADDYVPKPCTPRELVARLRAILRRSDGSETFGQGGPISAGPLAMWPEKRRAEWDGRGARPHEHRVQPARRPGAERGPRRQQGANCPNRGSAGRSRGSTAASTCTSAACARRSARSPTAAPTSRPSAARATSS